MKKIRKVLVWSIIVGSMLILVLIFKTCGNMSRVNMPLESQVMTIVDSTQKESMRITFKSHDTIIVDIQRFFALKNESWVKHFGNNMSEEIINNNDNKVIKWFKTQKNRVKDNISQDTIVIESICSKWQNATRYGNIYGGYDSINIPYLMEDVKVNISGRRRDKKITINIIVNYPKFVSKDLSMLDLSKLEVKNNWLVQPINQDSVEMIFTEKSKFIADSIGTSFDGFNISCSALVADLEKQFHFMKLEYPGYKFVYLLVSEDRKYSYSSERVVFSENGNIEIVDNE